MHVHLDPEQERQLQEVAEQEGVGPNELARRLIQEGLARMPDNGTGLQSGDTFFDAATRLGLIGCAGPGLPRDLSMNRKHMEGFGKG